LNAASLAQPYPPPLRPPWPPLLDAAKPRLPAIRHSSRAEAACTQVS